MDAVSITSELSLEEEILSRASTSRDSRPNSPRRSQKAVVNEQISFINTGQWNVKIDDKAACSLALKIPDCDLTLLDLSGRNFGPRAVAAISKALPLSKITSLNLSDAPLGRIGVRALADALPNSHLVELRLFNTRLRDPDLHALSDVIPRSSVELFDVGWNRISDRGAEWLADVIPTSRLRNISVQANDITNKGAFALAEALAKSKVVYFNASQNKIGDKGIQRLCYVCSNSKTICAMWLRANLTSDKALAVLERDEKYRHVSFQLPPRVNEKITVRVETEEEKKARLQAEFEERRALSIANPMQKPNAPCACLSGLKYKKCCKLRYMTLMATMEEDKRREELESWARK